MTFYIFFAILQFLLLHLGRYFNLNTTYMDICLRLSVKYLGVTLCSDLSWTEHINNVCSNANKTLGFLRRNLKISSRRIKETAYKTYVRPIMEYTTTVWDPHTHRTARLSMMYKIHHDLACVDSIKMQLQPLSSRQRRGHNQQFVLPQCRTQYHQKSFLPRTIKQWNGLPQEVIEANTMDTFVSMASSRE